MSWFLYTLKSQKGNGLYVGISQDSEKRLSQHNAGKTFSTRSRRPFTLVYQEEHPTSESARQREKYLKSYTGADEKQRLANILGSSQAVRQGPLKPPCDGSIPSSPASNSMKLLNDQYQYRKARVEYSRLLEITCLKFEMKTPEPTTFKKIFNNI